MKNHRLSSPITDRVSRQVENVDVRIFPSGNFRLLMYGDNVKASVSFRGDRCLVLCEGDTVVSTDNMKARTQVTTYSCVHVWAHYFFKLEPRYAYQATNIPFSLCWT